MESLNFGRIYIFFIRVLYTYRTVATSRHTGREMQSNVYLSLVDYYGRSYSLKSICAFTNGKRSIQTAPTQCYYK